MMSDLIAKKNGHFQLKTFGSFTWLGLWWAWSPYTKCSFRCVYCSVEAQGKSKPIATIDALPNIFSDFAQHQGAEVLSLGTLADTYPAEEAEYGFMRHVIPLLQEYGIKFSIITHGDIVARDIDLLVDNPSLIDIRVSIPHRDDAVILQYEPGSPTFEAKRDAVYKMYAAGLNVQVNIAPWIPGVTDVDAIAREFPSNMKIFVCALSYMDNLRIVASLLDIREKSSAERVFFRQFSTQSDINTLFCAERDKIGSGSKGNVNWLPPPGAENSPEELMAQRLLIYKD